jgi:uncharacterized membrane protein YgcG
VLGAVVGVLVLLPGQPPGAASAAGAPARPASARAPLIGIADEHLGMFYSLAFRKLRVHITRLIVPWDAFLRHTRDVGWIAQWIRTAELAHVEPLVAFSYARGCYSGGAHARGRIVRRARCRLPSVDRYRRAFLAFHRRFPEVRTFSVWNEANHRSQPTFDRPDRAAAFYNVVRARCRGCEIVAADVLDQPGFVGWLRRFTRFAHGHPRIWGLHNYEDTNHHVSRATRAMLRAVRGEVWLTETGGIVKFGHWSFSPRRAATATAYMFRLARLSPRITRLYIYQWSGARRRARFDAGLTGPGGRPRPAYFVVKGHLVHGSPLPPGFHPPEPPAPRPPKPSPGSFPAPPGPGAPPPGGGGGGSGGSGSGGGGSGGGGSSGGGGGGSGSGGSGSGGSGSGGGSSGSGGGGSGGSGSGPPKCTLPPPLPCF